MRAQTSFEYLIIIAIVIGFLLPVWAYVSSMQQMNTDQLALAYAKNAVEKITDTASLVYSQGYPAKVVTRVYIPKGIEESIVSDNLLKLRVRTLSGVSDIWATSVGRMNLTEGLNLTSEGVYMLSLEANQNDYVQISRA
jgi:uncharacterized protein (UPF0333 family)